MAPTTRPYGSAHSLLLVMWAAASGCSPDPSTVPVVEPDAALDSSTGVTPADVTRGCLSGTFRCEGSRLEACVAGTYLPVRSCATGLCDAEAGTCRPAPCDGGNCTCTPGCLDEHTRLSCNDAGSSAATCPAYAPWCRGAGECVECRSDAECTSLECIASTCSNEGRCVATVSPATTSCGPGKLQKCDGKGSCGPCINGTTGCVANTPWACNKDGVVEFGECKDSVCQEGLCVPQPCSATGTCDASVPDTEAASDVSPPPVDAGDDVFAPEDAADEASTSLDAADAEPMDLGAPQPDVEVVPDVEIVPDVAPDVVEVDTAPACLAGGMRCTDGRREVCRLSSPGGLAWSTFACSAATPQCMQTGPDDADCVRCTEDSQCPGTECAEPRCDLATHQCTTVARTRCGQDNAGFCSVLTGECLMCQPLTWQCTGGVLQQCAADGRSWIVRQDCGTAELCDSDTTSGRCRECLGSSYTCTRTSAGYDRIKCDGAGRVTSTDHCANQCTPEGCVECVTASDCPLPGGEQPGECQQPACVSNRCVLSPKSAETTCSTGRCLAGQGICSECIPGTNRCSPDGRGTQYCTMQYTWSSVLPCSSTVPWCATTASGATCVQCLTAQDCGASDPNLCTMQGCVANACAPQFKPTGSTCAYNSYCNNAGACVQSTTMPGYINPWTRIDDSSSSFGIVGPWYLQHDGTQTHGALWNATKQAYCISGRTKAADPLDLRNWGARIVLDLNNASGNSRSTYPWLDDGRAKRFQIVATTVPANVNFRVAFVTNNTAPDYEYQPSVLGAAGDRIYRIDDAVVPPDALSNPNTKVGTNPIYSVRIEVARAVVDQDFEICITKFVPLATP